MNDGLSEGNEVFELELDSLIALAHILDDFEEFSSSVKEIIENSKNIGSFELSSYILKIKKNRCVFSRKINEFYKNNEATIKTIMQYSGILEFMISNYGSVSGDIFPDMQYFYHYMMENRDKLDQILTLLEYMKRLGVKRVQIDPNLEERISRYTYTINGDYQRNIYIIYSDGVQILPNILSGDIKYKIAGENYIIKIGDSFSLTGPRMKVAGPIIVKNLLFDVKLLPEDLSKENTFDKIVELNKVHTKKGNVIRQSVHLSVLIDGFSDQYNYGVKVLEMLEDASTKGELIKILEQIRTQLDEMQIVSMRYDDSITQGSDEITQEQLQKEKRFYLERQSQL